jgi:hypothetical protein
VAKKYSPLISTTSVEHVETSTSDSGMVSAPRSAHLIPSTTPTLGFRADSVRQGSSIRLLG